MSLALNAGIINDDNNNFNITNFNNNNNNNLIYKKKHNKTQRLIEDFNTDKVNSVLNSIHNNSFDENNNNMGDFKPINLPQSAAIERLNNTIKDKKLKEENEENEKKEGFQKFEPKPIDNENIDLQNLNNLFMNDKEVEKYYKKLDPNYDLNNYKNNVSISTPPFNNNYTNDINNNKILIDKINYMIHLLEEQKDNKINNVTEEIILYSFLGIFIIFIVDSFVRIGKYIR